MEPLAPLGPRVNILIPFLVTVEKADNLIDELLLNLDFLRSLGVPALVIVVIAETLPIVEVNSPHHEKCPHEFDLSQTVVLLHIFENLFQERCEYQFEMTL